MLGAAHGNAAKEGALTGVASAVADVVGTGLTKTGTSNTAWTSGGKEHMEPVRRQSRAVLFTGGLAGIGAVRQAASQRAKAAGLSPGTTEFLSQLTNTALSAPLYAGLAPAMLGATHLAGAATRSIQNAVD